MTALARTIALAAALVAVALARPQALTAAGAEAEVDPLEVQGLLEEFQAISEREGERRRRAAPDQQLDAAVVEPENPDTAAVQGLIDEFQAISARERERREAPAQPEAAAAAVAPAEAEAAAEAAAAAFPVQGLLQEFAESGRDRRAAPAPAADADELAPREYEPLLLQGLQELLGQGDDDQQ